MKTRIIATIATVLISTSFITANANTATLTFYDAQGTELTIPVAEEEAETIPAEVKDLFESATVKPHNHVFDITRYSKPEQEEELPFDLNEVLAVN